MKKTLFLVLILAVVLSAVFIGCNEPTENVEVKVDIVEENVEIKEIGATVKLTATVTNGGVIEWSSADEAIATVSSDGTVTAVANGVTEITATSGGVTDTCVIVVNQAIIPELGLSVSFAKTSTVLSATLGETYQLNPKVTKNEVDITGATLTWSSSDKSKAIVSESGLITAVSNTDGEPVVITCKAEYEGAWAEASFYVTVKDDTDITFLTSQKVFYTTDAEINIPVSVKINGVTYNGTPEYSSGDTTVVKVENNKIIPVGTGNVTVYASVNGEAKGYEITIRQKIYVSTAEEFINISAGNEHVTYELKNDITLTNDDFIYENVGGSGVKTVKVYAISTFKGELIGNGYEVKYVYTTDYNGEFNNESFAGLFYNIEETAKIREAVFVGDITVDYPHMYTFANANNGLIENCFIRTSRRQLAAASGWNGHYNTAGGVFNANAGRVKDTIVYASYYAGATDTTDKGDNLVMYGTQGVGTYENVAFVSKFNRIGNHAGANWNKALVSSELVNLVHYTNMGKVVASDGQRITNPNNSNKYGDYVRTACSDQKFDSNIWTISDDSISLCGKELYKDVRITSNVTNIVFAEGEEESLQLEITVNQDEKDVTFTSSNPEVATVTDNGLVEFVGPGIANIVVKHVASGESISIPVKAMEEAYVIKSAEDLKAYAEVSGEFTYGYLDSDIVLEAKDIQEEEQYRFFIDSFSGILDGKGHKITYNYTADEGIVFSGVIRTVNASAIIKNVEINGFFSTKTTGGRALFGTFNGLLEDSYVEVFREQREPSGNNQLTGSIIATQNGTIRNTVINASGIVGDGTKGSRGLPIQNTGSGVYENVAFITAEKSIGWRTNGVYGTTINEDKLVNFRYYSSVADFVQDKGFLVSANEETSARYDYKFTSISGAQDVGSAFEVDSTKYDESLAFCGRTIWERAFVEVETKAEFIEKMNNATEETVIKLKADLEFTTADFVKEDNTSTGVKNKDIYLIKEFKGTLVGDGHTIRWYLDDTASKVGENTVSESNVKGLIYTMTASATIAEVRFIGESVVDADGQAAFITNMNGTIENCYLDVTRRQTASKGNWQATGGIFHKNEGLIKDCIILAKGPTGATGVATRGAKLVYGGTTAGRFENIALIQPEKNIGTRNGANANSYINDSQLNNLVWYKTVADFIAGNGQKVTNEGNDKTFEYTDITENQTFGSIWTISEEEIKLDGKTAWVNIVITTNVNKIDLVQDEIESAQIEVFVNGELTTDVTFESSNESVVTVTESGEVNFVGVGSAIITVVYNGKGFTVQIPVTATGTVEELIITTNVSEIDLVQDEIESAQIEVFANGELTTDVTFESSNESVVTVTESGEVNFVGVGSAIITVVYNGNGTTVQIPVTAKAAINKVSTVEEFLALSGVEAGKEVYLAADIVLTDLDAGENTSFVTEFKGILNGNGYKITFTYGETEAKAFNGLFGNVSGQLKNLTVIGSANTNKDYSSAFIGTLNKGASVSDSYVEVFVNQTASASGNYGDVRRVIGTNNGTVENVIFNVSSANNGGSYMGMPLQSNGTAGVYKNVAVVMPSKRNSWRNGVYNKKLYASQLDNVVYYSNMGNLMVGKGELISTVDNKHTYTPIEEDQDLGEAIVITSTANSGSISILGNVVYKRSIKSIWNEEGFIKAMNESSSSDVYMLMRDLDFTTEDFTKVSNGSTKAKNKDIYLVKEFKGTLLGAGHTIRWYLNDTASIVGTNTVSESNVKGLIETLAVTARISEVRFIGESVVDADGQAAFITNMNGTIENCYLDVTRRQTLSSSKNWQATGGIFYKNEGTIRNCIIIAKGPTGVSGAATNGAKLVYGGSTAGIFENIALVQPKKNIGTRNGANANSYINDSQLNNVVWYDSVESLVKGKGEIVTNEDNDEAFEYTAIYKIQEFGESILMDKDKIYLAARLAWTDDVIAADKETIEFTQDIYESEQITMYVDGEVSTNFTFTSSNESVATVSASGLVEFVGAGKANIIATYKVDGSQVVIAVESRASISVSTEAEFKTAMANATDTTIIKLVADLEFTTSDFTKVLVNETAAKSHYTAVVDSFSGTLFGEGHKITYTYDAAADGTTISGTKVTASSTTLRGFFNRIEASALIKGVHFVGNTSVDANSQYKFAWLCKGTIEDCYIDTTHRQLAVTSSRPYEKITATFGAMSGTVRNTIVKNLAYRGVTGTKEYGGMICAYNEKNLTGSGSTSSGLYENVAIINAGTSRLVGSLNGFSYSTEITASKMVNLVHYLGMTNFLAGTGETVGIASSAYSFTAIESAQTFGSAWTVDATGIKLNGTYVYKVVSE